MLRWNWVESGLSRVAEHGVMGAEVRVVDGSRGRIVQWDRGEVAQWDKRKVFQLCEGLRRMQLVEGRGGRVVIDAESWGSWMIGRGGEPEVTVSAANRR